ncbi:MAG TPA: hypothetical protein VIO61_13130 [Anaerolineaceae bacterium]
MSDILGRVVGEQNIFQKILGKIPGFSGYFDRANRRAADKLLRDTIANRFEEQWKRISGLQRDLISQGGIAYIDDLEVAALKLRQFIDRIRTASYGYAGFFDAVKVNKEELAAIYEHDYALLQSNDAVTRAVDNVERSIGTDGLPAAIRNLISVSQDCVTAFDRRAEVILNLGSQQTQ